MSSSKEVMNVADRLEAVQLASSEAADQKGEDEGKEVKQCASCGQSSNALKKCTACKSAWYCNVSCQKAHRKAHKKECKRNEKELKGEPIMQEGGERRPSGPMEGEKFSLWNPKPREACPICMCVLPISQALSYYATCCGNVICSACLHWHLCAVRSINAEKVDGAPLMDFACPFCRMSVTHNDEELLRRIQKRVHLKDGCAMLVLAMQYRDGTLGLSVDKARYIELLHEAANHGSLRACYRLSNLYCGKGEDVHVPGISKDLEKAVLYSKIGAIGGDLMCRFYLGTYAFALGNKRLAARHWRISAAAGQKQSADMLTECFQAGIITKKDLEESERLMRRAKEEMWSEEREGYIDALKEEGKYDEERHGWNDCTL